MARSLLAALVLSIAALGAGVADARDLEKDPMAGAPVPCLSKGPGFVRMPGSQACFRVSNRVTAGAGLRTGPRVGAPAVTGRLAIDNRADTDLGEVRTYVRIGNGRR